MDRHDEGVLPKAVKLLWNLDDPGTRGPKRGLSLDQIVEAAITIGDAEGFAAISMGRIAKELGFTPMSLYRYVDSKDTLVDILLDRVIGPPPQLPADAGWRANLQAWAWAEFHAIRVHDWWLDIPMSTPPLGPNNMDWLETGMAALAALPIPEPQRLQLVTNLSFFVIGRARFLRDTIGQAEDDTDYAGILAQVLDPTRYPAITSALTNRAFDDDDMHWEEGDFGFALDRLLDGYEHYMTNYTR
ncbi:TetR family transcriptional regulator [Nocardia sp. SYP-A9097]|uniref:TetR/AcrR family transcriptional regulator n=1 Tax=Nocardia sp. SYP-A9097 TaxID=2663237 RepID=UPI00129B34BB|nr:TetR/AcrR family transcriptional regulator [Nocardia sp. SYP-A9097]MRH91844.1 TetR family transcriptional regulator [Nocardia sp. SYP-A9097]